MPCKHPKTCDVCSVGLPVIDGLGGDPRPWLPGAQRLGGQITDAALGAPPEPGASADGSLENAQRRRGTDRGERADRPELDLRVVLASGAGPRSTFRNSGTAPSFPGAPTALIAARRTDASGSCTRRRTGALAAAPPTWMATRTASSRTRPSGCSSTATMAGNADACPILRSV